MQSSLVGIVVPDKDAFFAWAKKKFATVENAYESEEVKKEFLKELNAYGKENDLKGFEQIRAVYLTPNEFTIDNDLLTPTFKLKRETAKTVYKSQIDSLYAILSNGRAFN